MTAQTQTHSTRELRLAARQGLQPARGEGWLSGFNNMLGKELGEWFHTRRMLWQVLIWVVLIGGFTTYILFFSEELGPADIMGMTVFFSVVAMAGSVGVIILAQDEIIQEKQTGTAAWILSKPASRATFILTKLLSNIIGAIVFIIVIPGLVVLGEIFLAIHQLPSMVPFLAAVGFILLALVYDISLVILLGVLFASRGPVLGIALGIMLGGMFFGSFFPKVAYILPTSMDKVALLIAQGIALPPMFVTEVIVTAISSVIFVIVAVWSFQKKEL